MPDTFQDPSGNTAAFRAFAHPAEAPAAKPAPNLPMIIGGLVAVAVVLALIGWLALG